MFGNNADDDAVGLADMDDHSQLIGASNTAAGDVAGDVAGVDDARGKFGEES